VIDPAKNEGLQSDLTRLSADLGMPQPVEDSLVATDGARIRYACWRTEPAERLGAVLCLNGRTEFIEKTMDIYALFTRSGLDVWTLDWRGQGLSERRLADRHKGHVDDYQQFLDDLDQFVSEVTDLGENSGKTILLAHSMGGHIGFRYLHDRPGLFDCAMFSAPMIDLSVNTAPLRLINSGLIRLGLGERYALGTGRFDFAYKNPDDPNDNGTVEDYKKRFKTFDMLTSDARKFMEIQGLIRSNPALALGGPTAAWLDATFRSINLTWAPGYAEAIKTPVLMVGGGRDRVVVTKRQEEMAERLPNARFLQVDEASHEFLIECDDIRSIFLEAFADFTGVPMTLPPQDVRDCIRS
jgi:lysophospholipase